MRKKDYQMVALDRDIHEELKRFCVMNGYTINGLMTKLAKECIAKHSQQQVKQEA